MGAFAKQIRWVQDNPSQATTNKRKEAFYLKNKHFSQTFPVVEITRNPKNVLFLSFYFLSVASNPIKLKYKNTK